MAQILRLVPRTFMQECDRIMRLLCIVLESELAVFIAVEFPDKLRVR